MQRASILGEIALDVYILRLITPLQVKLSNLLNGRRKTEPGDIDVALALVDEWGRGFVAEVDYKLEARNADGFLKAMQQRGLNAVTSPAVVFDLSTNKVIVTEWMDGTRLDRDASPDVPRLVSHSFIHIYSFILHIFFHLMYSCIYSMHSTLTSSGCAMWQ